MERVVWGLLLTETLFPHTSQASLYPLKICDPSPQYMEEFMAVLLSIVLSSFQLSFQSFCY